MGRFILGALLILASGIWGVLLGGLTAATTASAHAVGWDALARALGWMAVGGALGLAAGGVAAYRLAERRLAPVLAAVAAGGLLTLAAVVVRRLALP